MPQFVRSGGSASDDQPTPTEQGSMRVLTDKFYFLPPPGTIDIPAGWFGLLKKAARRLSCVVPVQDWGRAFLVTSLSVKDGGLEIEAMGGNESVTRVLGKVRRISLTICCECGTPGILFPSKLGLRPHCPRCLELPALHRDLEKVLGWQAGLEGPGGIGVQVHRIPPTLRPSFRQWQQASGLDPHEFQPWDLEGWLRDLARAQKTLRRGFS